MIILDRLPIADRPHLINVQGELFDIYRNQIVVWVSIADARRPFPALLETGHGHNFSISGGQLRRWSSAALEKIGELEIGKTMVSQFRAEMNLHANVRGRFELSGRVHRLEMPQGISVFDDGSADAPRLPAPGVAVDHRESIEARDRWETTGGDAEDHTMVVRGIHVGSFRRCEFETFAGWPGHRLRCLGAECTRDVRPAPAFRPDGDHP